MELHYCGSNEKFVKAAQLTHHLVNTSSSVERRVKWSYITAVIMRSL